MISCWQCGVEPTEVLEVTALGVPEPRYLPGRWPAGDHPHAVDAPTPEHLADAADAVRERMLRNAAR